MFFFVNHGALGYLNSEVFKDACVSKGNNIFSFKVHVIKFINNFSWQGTQISSNNFTSNIKNVYTFVSHSTEFYYLYILKKDLKKIDDNIIGIHTTLSMISIIRKYQIY